jgi:GNAT superfamily N-acetyltransferase
MNFPDSFLQKDLDFKLITSEDEWPVFKLLVQLAQDEKERAGNWPVLSPREMSWQKLRAQAITKPISIDGFQANFLAVQGDTVLGLCRLTSGGYYPELDAKTTEIHQQVLPEFRNQGLGHKMLKFLAEQAPNYGYQFLSSISSSPAAIHILKKAGFEKNNEFDDGSTEFTAPVETVLERLGAATDLHPA